ncbi:hypothetical protein [Qipengyuania sp. JC766]|uniref:hypothetical protein n=1 Tax=Qipengyuania sp. JC766 TaxID=3232139 RepID=UPI00345806AA
MRRLLDDISRNHPDVFGNEKRYYYERRKRRGMGRMVGIAGTVLLFMGMVGCQMAVHSSFDRGIEQMKAAEAEAAEAKRCTNPWAANCDEGDR